MILSIATVSLVSIAVFLGALWALGIVGLGINVLGTANGALTIMRDNGKDDEAREIAVRGASLQLFTAFAAIAFRGAAALMASFLPIWLADFLGLASVEDVFLFLSRWEVVSVATIATVGGYFAWKRLCRFR